MPYRLAIVLVVVTGIANPTRASEPTGLDPSPRRPSSVQVVDAVDGELLAVSSVAGPRLVRLIGVRAPRPGLPLDGGEPHGDETLAWIRRHVVGRSVRLLRDPDQPRGGRDVDAGERGAPSVYVRLDDGRLLNEVMLAGGLLMADGWAKHALRNRFLTIERQARGNRIGLWSSDAWRRHHDRNGRALMLGHVGRKAPAPSLEAYVRRLGVAPVEERLVAFEEAVRQLEIRQRERARE